MVLEIPPADEASITGTVMIAGRRRIEDVGRPASTRARAGSTSSFRRAIRTGSRRLHPMPSVTIRASRCCARSQEPRATPTSPRPLSMASGSGSTRCRGGRARRPTTFVDAIDVVFDADDPLRRAVLRALDRMVQPEPWLERDKAMIDCSSRSASKRASLSSRTDSRKALGRARRKRMPGSTPSYETLLPAVLRGRPLGFAGLTGVLHGLLTTSRTRLVPARRPGRAYSRPFSARSTWVPGSSI